MGSYQDVYACLIEASRTISQFQLIDQCFLVDQISSANLMSLGIFQLLVSSLVDGVVPVMWKNGTVMCGMPVYV